MLIASAPGEALRTYEVDLEGGKPQPTGPPGFQGWAVASSGGLFFAALANHRSVDHDRLELVDPDAALPSPAR